MSTSNEESNGASNGANNESTATPRTPLTGGSSSHNNTTSSASTGIANDAPNTASAGNRRAASAVTPFVQSVFHLVTQMLQLLLWPVRRFLFVLFPLNELDGLSPAVTRKAAEQFRASIPNTEVCCWESLAFSAAQQQAHDERKLLLVYLDSPLHPHSIAVRNAITTALSTDNHHASEGVTQSLVCLGVSIASAIGTHLQSMLHVTALPAVVVLQPRPRSTTTTTSANASQTPWQLMVQVQGPALVAMRTNLSTQWLPLVRAAVQRHDRIVQEQLARDWQRHEETQLRQQQDEEYQAALRADQERERLQQEAAAQEQAAQEHQEEMERERQRALQRARDSVRDEPTTTTTTTRPVTLRLVLPNGKKVQRKFHNDDTFQIVRNFLKVHIHDQKLDVSSENLGLSTNFPKQDYNDPEHDNMTLHEAGLGLQAVLMVQDLDA